MHLSGRWKTVCSAAVFGIGALLLNPGASADERAQARRLHDRIAGVPPDATTLNEMAGHLPGDPLRAAMIATEAPEFYSVTLKNFAAPWTNRERDVFVPLNDYIATVIGLVRDEADFRDLLSADIVYVGSGAGVPAYSTTSNAHYEALERQGVNLRDNLQPVPQSSVNGLPGDATAGVMTSRAAAQAFFIAGTNRAMFRFTLWNHLCNDMEQVLDTSRAADRIRQDISRSPGGDSRVFLNNCIGCHSGMDPLAQAYAYYDYQYDPLTDPEGRFGMLTYNRSNDIDPVTGTRVVAKYFNNATTFEYGFRTPDDAWDNYWRAGPNSLLGWDSALPGSGQGAKSMGRELAHSDAFAQCQVKKVFQNVCLRAPQSDADRTAVEDMVQSLRTNAYNLKQTFGEAAVYCMGE